MHAKTEVSMWHMLVSNNLWIKFLMCFLPLVLNFIRMRLMNLCRIGIGKSCYLHICLVRIQFERATETLFCT